MEGYAVRADEAPQKGCTMTRGEMRTFMSQAKSKQMQLRILCELNPGMSPGRIYEAVKDLAPGLKKPVDRPKGTSGGRVHVRCIASWKAEALKLHQEGEADVGIAMAIGVERKQVTRWRLGEGLVANTPSEKRRRRIAEMIQAGMETADISNVVGVSRQTVGQIRRRMQEAEVEG